MLYLLLLYFNVSGLQLMKTQISTKAYGHVLYQGTTLSGLFLHQLVDQCIIACR